MGIILKRLSMNDEISEVWAWCKYDIKCPYCHDWFEVKKDVYIGKDVVCPYCSNEMRVTVIS
jgi:hypothetical protein